MLDGYKVIIITFPDREKALNVVREVAQADISYFCALLGYGFGAMGEGNDEAWENYQKASDPEIKTTFLRSLGVVLCAGSTREME